MTSAQSVEMTKNRLQFKDINTIDKEFQEKKRPIQAYSYLDTTIEPYGEC